MYNAKTIILAKALRPDLNFASPGAEELIWLKIASRYASGNPVRDATITNGIAYFDRVSVSQPLVSLKLNIPVTQTGSGTPSPDNIRDIVGVQGVNIPRTGKNLLNPNSAIIPHTTYGFFHVISANIPLIMSITDNDTSVDLSGVTFGFALALTEGGQQPEISSGYKWIVSGGTEVASYINNSYLSSYMNEFAFYPKNQATLNKIFARYNIQIELGSEEATSYEQYTGNIYPITFGQTVYSAILEALTGKLSITHIRKAMSDLEWQIVPDSSSGFGFNYFRIADNIEDMNSLVQLVCDCLVNNMHSRGDLRDGEIGRYNSSSYNRRLVCRVDSITTIEDWNTFIADKYIVYELATPIEIQLTPTQIITTLIGENVIFADVADVTECKYTRK